MTKKSLSLTLLGTVFACMGLLYLLNFIIYFKMMQLFLHLVWVAFYFLLAGVVWFRWDKTNNWLKWVIIFLAGQLILSFSLPFLREFLYPHKIGIVYTQGLGEKLLWKVNYIINFPENILRGFMSKRLPDGRVIVYLYGWKVFLVDVLNKIYIGLVALLIKNIYKKIKG